MSSDKPIRVRVEGHQYGANGELLSAGVSETGPYAIVMLDHGAVQVYPLAGAAHKCATYWLTREAVCAEPAPTTASAPANSESDHPKSIESILREALARLVALKDLYDQCENSSSDYDDTDGSDVQAMWQKYRREKPLAWEAARSALAGIPR